MAYPPHYSLIPTTIDQTGKTDVTRWLREWEEGVPLRPTDDKEDGQTYDRRQGRLRPVPSPAAGYAAGMYRVDGGAWLPSDFDLDLDGAKLYVGDRRDVAIPGTTKQPWRMYAAPLWPRQRATLHVERSCHVFSRRGGARLWGANFTPNWLGGFRPPDRRAWPVGSGYPGQAHEGQHGIAVHDDDCVLDLRNIEVAYTYGDGVGVAGHAHGTEVIGTPNRLAAVNEPASASVVRLSDGTYRWKPADVATHGIHRTGRGAFTQAGGSDLWVHGVPAFSIGRSWIDFEPGAGGVFADALIEDCIIGTFQNLWVAAAGNGWVNDVVLRRNRSIHRPLSIVARKPPSGRRLRWSVTDNYAEDKAISGSTLAVMRFDSYDGVEVARNRQRVNWRAAGVKGLELANCVNTSAPDLDKQFVA